MRGEKERRYFSLNSQDEQDSFILKFWVCSKISDNPVSSKILCFPYHSYFAKTLFLGDFLGVSGYMIYFTSISEILFIFALTLSCSLAGYRNLT